MQTEEPSTVLTYAISMMTVAITAMKSDVVSKTIGLYPM